MKLYYSPGACSLAPHIVLEEMALPHTIVNVDIKKKTTAQGDDYKKINPKGSVPALEISPSNVLTEAAVILQYLADLKPELGLMPKVGSMERYRCLEWLNFISTDLHKSYSPLFAADFYVPSQQTEAHEFFKEKVRENAKNKIDYLAARLPQGAFLMGDQFMVVDAYLYVVLSWSKFVGIDLKPWPQLLTYFEKIKTRPSTQKALTNEGLLKK